MNYAKCIRCKLTLPRHALIRIKVRNKSGQIVPVLICRVCKARLDKQVEKQKEKTDGTQEMS